ncbi:C2 domain-containing protein [Cephalotus follicularis]|uniref:C2 domain-containing protein n=1 Tax=Cephalotus follicularis TaxID=3775 RepID=A0A1Q3D038_CEPFO|nr:C2 domain-containing protein [Cephalotus follicularis]
MEQRTIEIDLISAADLKNVNLISKMDVYTVVYLSGDPSSKQKAKTTVDREGGNNPTWNFPMKFTIDESLAQQNCLTLVFKLKCERSLGDKDVGEVNVPVKELLDPIPMQTQFVSYQVRKPSGRPKGVLNFSFKVGDKVVVNLDKGVGAAYPAPVVGPSTVQYGGPSGPYPPPPVAAGYGYSTPPPAYEYAPPPPVMAGYEYQPPPPGYEYPPPQPAYGYPQQAPMGYPAQGGYGYGYPPVQQPARKNKVGGLGLGAGLLGGVLGGLLIGDLVSDIGGFDDGGGFF